MTTKLKQNSDNSNKNNAIPKENFASLELVENHIKDITKGFTNPSVGLLKIQTANEWMTQARNKAPQKMLLSTLWFENELCILFADTNLGKSILAVQAGDSISKGEDVDGYKNECDPQIVLYLDFELTERQFRKRYTSESEPMTEYQFSENFIRAEIDPDMEIPTEYEDKFEIYLSHSIELAIVQYNAKVLIIDNLTWIKTGTEKSGDALPLMKHLKRLKSKYDLSILALAHTPKRELSKPITRNDLQGSKMLINFCDCSFAIGESSQDSSLRYIKQIKVRNAENFYDSDNVAVCEIVKNDNFLGFKFIDFGKESDHLKEMSSEDRDELDNSILELKRSKPEISNYEISKQLNINKMRVGRVLKRNSI